jgi:hypothetical protein
MSPALGGKTAVNARALASPNSSYATPALYLGQIVGLDIGRSEAEPL